MGSDGSRQLIEENMEETDLDEMNPEFGNEFWKELTDDVLDTLYSQLEYVEKGHID